MRIETWAYDATAALGNWSDAGWRAYAIAWIHYRRGDTGAATAWADRMAEAMRRGGDERGQANATRIRGLVAGQRGDLAEAERLYTEALNSYRQLNKTDDEAVVLADLGVIARRRNEYDRAEGYYRQALAIHEQSGHLEYQCTDYGNLGLLALYRSRPAEARTWFERVLVLAREVGRQDSIAGAQAGLARVLEEEGRPREALPLAEEALRIYERLRYRDLEWIRRLVARLREKAGTAQ